MPSEQATQACVACRRLKRKCTRELPSCSLCIRLTKSCEYPHSSKIRRDAFGQVHSISKDSDGFELRQEARVQHANSLSMSDIQRNESGLALKIPDVCNSVFTAIFLDSTSHPQITADRRDPGIPVPSEILDSLGSMTAIHSLCDTYFRGTHTWLPMLSRKRLLQKVNNFNTDADIGLALLLMCMKLVSEVSTGKDEAATSPLYCIAKRLYSIVENSGLISIQLLQSAILIAANEIGHGIYPAGYLSVGHAARLGIMMGLHDRKNATQLFKEADTWTQSEEERRTWWAVVILDRYVNIGMSGFPLATPDPPKNALLPCSESSWDRGEMGSNEPLFASSFTPSSDVGLFASTCQASHILGLVLRHRDDRSDNILDPYFRFSEAQRLHQTLMALNTHLTQSTNSFGNNNGKEVAVAICFSARLVLYDMYACNEQYTAGRARIAEETEMQRASMEGLKEVSNGVSNLAQHISSAAMMTTEPLLSKSPLVCNCLYEASLQWAWFIREDGSLEGVARLKAIVELLKETGRKWQVSEDYLKLLSAEGTLGIIED